MTFLDTFQNRTRRSSTDSDSGFGRKLYSETNIASYKGISRYTEATYDGKDPLEKDCHFF